MADEVTDNFVEIDGVKYKEDPEKAGQALMGEDNQLVPFEEKKEETDEEKEAREKVEKEEKEKEEPGVRKSAKDWIIERKNKKIEKLEKKKDDDDDDDENKEKVTPEGKKAIEQEIDKKVKPILQTVRTQVDDQELQTVLKKYLVDEKTEKQIRKYMEHEAYKNVSVEFIFLGLAAKKMKLQEKREKADEEAKGDKTGGHEKRKKDLGPIPDVRGMDDKAVDDLIFKVKTGQL